MNKPINKNYIINNIPTQGRFGAIRKYDTHTGVDLYCNDNEPVYAIENGVVVNIVNFTGKDADSPWWNDTYAILIEGDSGVILYGEVYKPTYNIGDVITQGELIGNVKRVLIVDKLIPTTMLHIELYKKGYRGDGEWWREEMPLELINVEEILNKIYNE